MIMPHFISVADKPLAERVIRKAEFIRETYAACKNVTGCRESRKQYDCNIIFQLSISIVLLMVPVIT